MFFRIIIILNILIYFLGFIFGRRFFISNFSLYEGSEFYTFFTYSFLHSGFEHILFNLVMLFMLTQILKYQKQTHLIIVYLLGAIFSSLSYYFLMQIINYHNFILLGASGAVSALMGYAGVVLRQNGFFIVIAITSIISFLFFQNIAWQAHIFGAVFGAIYASLIYFLRR